MINKRLLDDITNYCELNGLDTNEFINKIVNDGFIKIKYGDKPSIIKPTIKKVEEPIKEEVVKETPTIEPKDGEVVKKEIIKRERKRDIYGE